MQDWFIDMNDCCGCGACAQACAHSCITMQSNPEGFLVPSVNRTNCVECGLCEKVCPVKNTKPRNKTPKVYIGRITDEQLLNSCSSGGMAYLMSKTIIEEGGVVFGVRFNEQWETVYDYAEDIERLEQFKGSKYIDAIVGDVYKQVQQFLHHGRKVLFIGTPCHVSGLNHFLRKVYDNLITVDIMCHAVPSPMVWKRYLNELTSDPIKKVSFRSKVFGWENYGVCIETSKGVIVHEPNDANIYMQGFLQGLTVRTSCANCSARRFSSGSDIMIGDYWELSKCYPDLYDEKGMSLIFACTSKGDDLLHRIQMPFFLKSISMEDVDMEDTHGTLYRSIRLHPNRQVFYSKQNGKKSKISKLIAECLKEHLTLKGKLVIVLKKLLGVHYYSLRKIWRKK